MARAGIRESWRGLDWRLKLLLAIAGFCFAVVVTFLTVILAYMGPHLLAWRSDQVKKNHAAAGVQELRSAIDAFSIDHNMHCPLDLQALLSKGYLDQMPENPYTKQPIRVIGKGDSIESGNLVYIPENIDPASNSARGYIMLLYGPERSAILTGQGNPDWLVDLPHDNPWIDLDRVMFVYRRGN